MIPKIINYCWFGGKPLDEMAIKCIDSWKKCCPEYEIKRWDESNFDINCCDYVREAYETKKWAFVSDFARFYILYKYGGVYFDTDVEILKNIDPIISNGAFMAWEENGDSGEGPYVNPGLGIAFEKNNCVCKAIIGKYESIHFIDDNGEINTYDNVVRITSEILSKYGLVEDKNRQVVCSVNIYPPEYFCPMNKFTGEIKITSRSYSIHLYSGSWLSTREKKCIAFEKKHKSILNNSIYKVCKNIYCFGFKNTFSKIKEKLC